MLTLFAPLSWPATGYTMLRYKWLVASLALLASAAAGITGLVRPRSYTGDALVQVDPRQVPDRLVPSPVNGDWQERLAALTRQLLTTARLRQVVLQFRLFPRESLRLPPDDVLALMRRRIAIRLDRTYDRPGAFHVTFEYRDPVAAAQVANHLARTLIELNVHDRLSSAGDASAFLDQQVRQVRRELELQDDRLSRFHLAHAGAMPGQEAVLIATLNRLQVQWQSAQDSLVRVQQLRAALADALYAAQTALPVAVTPPADGLRRQLKALRSRYQERHPDVRRLLAEVSAASAAETARPAPTSPEARERVRTLAAQMRDVLDEQAHWLRQTEALRLQMADCQRRLEQVPSQEVSWNSLHNDHEVARRQYQALIEKRSAAQLSAELERRQKDESFRVLEPARVPLHPSGPDWPAWALAGCLAGLLAAVPVALGLDLRCGLIQGEWELSPRIELLARVPHLGASAVPSARRGRRLPHWVAAVVAGAPFGGVPWRAPR